ncbi:MAG: hypothetical protein R3F19_10385 [Verrucomicrobiales bacterium]
MLKEFATVGLARLWRSGLIVATFLLLGQCSWMLAEQPTRIHVFVALCDNATQGIAPVNERIGNGNDPENNLYWGCSDGLPKFFAKNAEWKLVTKENDVSNHILRRVVFRHKATGALLLADAYRGSSIHQCMSDFLFAAAGKFPSVSESIEFGGASDLVAYIGHNGLMEEKIAEPTQIDVKRKRDAIVLSCRSHLYFYDLLRRSGARPILTTQQLMYPGSFALHAALEGWLKNESLTQLRNRAGKAMAKNQKLSLKAATNIFTEIER